MLYLLLPSGQIRPCSLATAPPGIDAEEHAARCLAATLEALPAGTQVLPVEAPPPQLAGIPPECWAWDEHRQALVLGSDLSAAWGQLRRKRDALLAGSDWRVTRARELAEKSKPGAAKELAALLDYRQALRDLPSAGGDPRAVTWPTPPWKE